MANEVRLIECRRCDARNCKGCNMYTLSEMLRRGEFDCMMDEHHSIVITPESLRPKGRWEYHDCVCTGEGIVSVYACSQCHGIIEEETFDNLNFTNYCPNCGADMRGDSE